MHEAELAALGGLVYPSVDSEILHLAVDSMGALDGVEQAVLRSVHLAEADITDGLDWHAIPHIHSLFDTQGVHNYLSFVNNSERRVEQHFR